MTARKVGRMWSSGVGEAMEQHRRARRPDPPRRPRPRRFRPPRPAPPLVGAGRRWRPRSLLVTAVGAVSLAAPRRNEVLMTLVFPLAGLALSSGARGHILRSRMVLHRRHLPRRTDGAAQRRAAAGDLPRRLRGRPPPLAAQRRRADPDRRRPRPGAGLRHRNRQRPALRLLLREGQRRPHPRPRRLRDLHPLPARPAGALAGRRATAASSPPRSRAWPGRSSARRGCRSASAARSRS